MRFIGLFSGVCLAASALHAGTELRIGMIGLDTSHVVAFTKLLNDPSDPAHVPGARVVAAFRGGSPDLESSRSRIDGFTRELQEKFGVELCRTIPELCRRVDAVMLESVDGRPHLAQAIPVILARKPLFIDKPMAASLRDVLALFDLAREFKTPLFSASSLRFGRNTQAVREGAIGRLTRAETTGPCHLDPTHPDLFWYGIHGVESLFTVMGAGCESVRRTNTVDGLIEVAGTWSGGRLGIYREAKEYGGSAAGEKGSQPVGANDGYGPLIQEVIRFFRTGVAPVPPEETIELFAFMEAADESLRRKGQPVSLQEIMVANGYAPAPTTQGSSAAPVFQVRRVVDAAGSDAEPMTLVHGRRKTDSTAAPVLQVQKVPLLDHTDLSGVAVRQDPATGAPQIELTFTEAGRKRLAALTRQSVGQRIAIVIDGQLLSAPVVRVEIPGGKAEISGDFSAAEAEQLAARIKKALPAPVP